MLVSKPDRPSAIDLQWNYRAGSTRYWPEPVIPRPAAAGAALNLLGPSIEQGATVIAIGALTNLALLARLISG
ncbi:MAG: hypothetical protein JOY61_22965 [Chloroflexi bacterium]|nr:hypothetical protein [Chloroflexota bacterium]